MVNLQRHPKSRMWRYRLVVPEELRRIVGKRELLRSLGTPDYAEAKRRSYTVAIEFEGIIQRAREQHVRESSLWSKWDIDEWASRCLGWIADDKGVEPEEIEETRAPAVFENLVREYAETCLPDIKAGSPDYILFLDAVLSEVEPHQPFEPEPRKREPWPLQVLYSSKANPISDDTVTTDRLFELWKTERKPEPKLLAEWRTVLIRFDQVVGQADIRKISKDQVRDFKDRLIKMPRVLSAAQRRMTMDDVIAGTNPETQRISAKTANKALQLLSALFSWAVKNDRMSANPALGIKAIEPRDKDRRVPYEPSDLALIFSSDLYRNQPWGANQWLPVLGLYTGARLEELGQALIKDVKCEDGVWLLNITDVGEGQSLKTKGSKRKVPLHRDLIRLGFLDYVEWLQTRAESRLFPDLSPDNRGKITQKWSRWWGRHARRLGITDKRKVFHSFRHGFKDACRRARIDEPMHDALTGHSRGGVSRSYGLGFDLATLAEVVDKISFPGFPL